MPCVTLPIPSSGQPLVPAYLADAQSASAGNYRSGECVALLDTGATSLAVSGRVAVRLGLSPGTGDDEIQAVIQTADGFIKAATYRVNLHIPIPGTDYVRHFPKIEAVEFSGGDHLRDGDFDIIIGMDVITAGSLHISNGHFTFCI